MMASEIKTLRAISLYEALEIEVTHKVNCWNYAHSPDVMLAAINDYKHDRENSPSFPISTSFLKDLDRGVLSSAQIISQLDVSMTKYPTK